MTNERHTHRHLSTADRDTPSREDLIARSRTLLPLLSRNAARSDGDRVLAEENMAALAGAGLLRLAVPHRYGGLQMPVRTMIDVTSTIAEACGSTAWVVANRYVCTWITSLLGSRAQDEIYGEDPDAGIAGAFAPSTQMRRVDGGVVASGKWYYCSGSAFAKWGLLGLLEADNDGPPINQYFALIPARELAIEDTWFTTGMRGTNSNCMVADASYAVSLATEAINMLVSAHGAGSFAESNVMQRIWRDANIAANHAALLRPIGMEVYGRTLLGVEKNISMMV